MQTHDYTININGYEFDCFIDYTYSKGYIQQGEPYPITVPDGVEISNIYYLDAGAVKQPLYSLIANNAPALLDEIKEEIRDENR